MLRQYDQKYEQALSDAELLVARTNPRWFYATPGSGPGPHASAHAREPRQLRRRCDCRCHNEKVVAHAHGAPAKHYLDAERKRRKEKGMSDDKLIGDSLPRRPDSLIVALNY